MAASEEKYSALRAAAVNNAGETMNARKRLATPVKIEVSFDFIVNASRAYNYMIWSINQELISVITEAGYLDLLQDIPDLFLVIESPISETKNIPIHCIFAHEIGHVLYLHRNMANKLIPRVQKPTDTMKEKIIKASWVEELAADAIALCILGPAYLYSFIYFTGPFCSMAAPSDTHPPDNLRIKFLCKMLIGNRKQEGLVYKNTLKNSLNLNYVQQWQSYATKSISQNPIDPQYRKIASSVNTALSMIKKEAKYITKGRQYTPRRYNKDVPELCENIAFGIPPSEIITGVIGEEPIKIPAESILNAGWSYLISNDNRLRDLLGSPDLWKVRERLFNLISAGLEYSEMKSRWSYGK